MGPIEFWHVVLTNRDESTYWVDWGPTVLTNQLRKVDDPIKLNNF